MQAKRLQIPGGMQDTLMDECQVKRRLEARLRPLFTSWGYREIETPILEYFDALDDDVWGYRPEHVWKTFDRDGRILAIRPDTTIPAVRLAASKLKDEPLPLRLSYLQSACKYERDTLSLLSEQTQAGIELMGVHGLHADMEVLGLAARSLRVTGIEHVQMEIGHVGFLRSILKKAHLSRDLERQVLMLLSQKNASQMRTILHDAGLNEDLCARLLSLTTLYGGMEVLDQARSLALSDEALAAIEDLHTVCTFLKEEYPDLEVSLDLGMEQEAGYYSGIVFQAQTRNVGQPILSGGRYDHLPERYGRKLPAVGFAMSLKLCMIALEKQGKLADRPARPMGLCYTKDTYRVAYRTAEALRQDGRDVALLLDTDIADAKQMLKEHQISRLGCVDETGLHWFEGGEAFA